MHDETYRMLGKEHQADLDREAEKWRRAAEVRGQARSSDPASKLERLRLTLRALIATGNPAEPAKSPGERLNQVPVTARRTDSRS